MTASAIGKMGSTVKDLKAYDVEQMAIIGKMHGMQWLKSNSLSSGQYVSFSFIYFSLFSFSCPLYYFARLL